jgi:hypothetical protein
VSRKRSEIPSGRDVEALGAEKLAELLLDAAARDEAVLARLQRQLATGSTGGRFAKTVHRQIRALTRHDFVAWDEAPSLAADIDTLRDDIVQELLPESPKEAAELLGEVVAAEGRIFEAVDDSDGEVGGALSRVVVDWGRAWAGVEDVDPEALADLVMTASAGNDYGTRDRLVPAFAPALGEGGLHHLEQRARAKLAKRPPRKDRDSRDWDPERSRLAHILTDIADVRNDPDLFVEALRLGGVVAPYAVEIAKRMLDAGRPEEALEWSTDGDERDPDRGLDVMLVKASALEALGRLDEAQRVRWCRVEACLDPEALDPFLERLPNDTARRKAKKEAQRLAAGHEDALLALWFLTERGELAGLDALVRARLAELDGAMYHALRPAAEALAAEHPVAAALLHRRMVESVLDRGRSTAYDHAARDVRRAAACARRVKGDPAFETHHAWMEGLRAGHGRKRSFWSRVDGGG